MADDDDTPTTSYQFLDQEPLAEDEVAPDSRYLSIVPCRAKVTYANKDTYEGEFNEQKQKHGSGKYTYYVPPVMNEDDEEVSQEGSYTYDGQWYNGSKHGLGKQVYPNGDVYHGEWNMGLRHGQGAYVTAGKDIYSGSWQNGMKHGRGTFVYAKDNSQLIGRFVQNKFKDGKWVFNDGTVYTGRFVQNKPDGSGVFTFPNGNSQTGEFILVGSKKSRKRVWKAAEITATR